MTAKGYRTTKAVYEDPKLVLEYTKAHSQSPALEDSIKLFASTLKGKNVIDIGCGPGHDSYIFAKLGFDTVGLDYSHEMIRAARKLLSTNHPPTFITADMRDIGNIFEENTFDGVWMTASMIHISEADVPKVLNAIFRISRNDAKVYIAVKGGPQGESMVKEKKYNMVVEREFVFWEREKLEKLIKDAGFTIERIVEEESNRKSGRQTTWLNFYLSVKK